MRPLTHHEATEEIATELEGSYLTNVDAALLVRYSYHPASKGATDGPGGPPIEPDTEESVEIQGVSLKIPSPDGHQAHFVVPLKADDYDDAGLAAKVLEQLHED